MSKLVDFLALPDVSDITKDVYINERLGTFKIRPMNGPQYSGYQNRCRGKLSKDGVDFDGGKFNMLIIAGQTVEPNFSNSDFLSKAGCANAADFISKKLLAGEISDIAAKIIKESGFDASINEAIEEAKN